MIEVSRRSPITGTISTILLDYHEREFLISGCTKEDWINIFGEDDD